MLRTCSALAGLALFCASPVEAADLEVIADGLDVRGEFVVALFDSDAGWRTRKNPVRQAIVPVTQPTARVRFSDLPPGRYAIMSYHDRDGDGRLDTLPIGLPTEPYGFSNGVRGTFGPPAWRAAAFDVPTSGASQSLRLR